MIIPREALLLKCFASRDKPHLSNILLEFIDGKGVAVATNAHYLGMLTWPCAEFESCVIKAEAVKGVLGGKKSTFVLEGDKIIRDDGVSMDVSHDTHSFPPYQKLVQQLKTGELDSIRLDWAVINSVSTYLKKAFSKQIMTLEFGENSLAPIKLTMQRGAMDFLCLVMPFCK